MTESRNNKIHPLAILGAFVSPWSCSVWRILFSTKRGKSPRSDQQAVTYITLIAHPPKRRLFLYPPTAPPTQPRPTSYR